MKMTGIEINAAAGVLMNLAGKKLPVKLSFALAVNLEKLTSWSKKLNEQRVKLAEEYADKNEDGKPVIRDNVYVIGDMDSFNKEVETLLKEEIDVDIRKVPFSELEALDTCERYDVLSMGEVAGLQFMVGDDEK